MPNNRFHNNAIEFTNKARTVSDYVLPAQVSQCDTNFCLSKKSVREFQTQFSVPFEPFSMNNIAIFVRNSGMHSQNTDQIECEEKVLNKFHHSFATF